MVAREYCSHSALRHPLGFLYIPLARWPEETLRLHIWPVESERRRLASGEVSPVHDHTWHLLSYVICGNVTNFVVDIEQDAVNPTNRVFEIYGAGLVDEIRATDTLVRVTGETPTGYGAGEIYSMGSDLLHRTMAGAGVTATLVLARRTSKRVERALGPIGLGSYEAVRERCPEPEVARAAASVLDALLRRQTLG